MLEQSRINEVDKLVVTGTVCAYPKHTPVPFQEDDLWDGYPEETNAPYGVAKKALLVGGQAYRQQYGLNAIHLLPANLYGPRDNFDLESSHVIPALIRKMIDSHGRGRALGRRLPTREFLFVDDCVQGLILAAERYDGADPVNLGTGVETSIREVAETIADVTGFEGGSPGTRRCRTASRAGHSTRRARRSCSDFGPASPPRGDRANRRLVREVRTDACSRLARSSRRRRAACARCGSNGWSNVRESCSLPWSSSSGSRSSPSR